MSEWTWACILVHTRNLSESALHVYESALHVSDVLVVQCVHQRCVSMSGVHVRPASIYKGYTPGISNFVLVYIRFV